MLAVNQILQNRYRIIRQLGEGGMGAVYEAEDNQRFGKPVALKEILLNLTNKHAEHFRRAFEREAKILTQIDHEAVPKVIGYILETDCQILVMELIEGDDLDEILEREKKPFSHKNVLDWADQLLDALDYLHTLKQPIIHRDIKPQNLKLTARNKIKLLDFGIAKDSEAEISATKSQTHKTFVGATLYYSPIEQIIRIPDYFEMLESIYPEKAKKIVRQSADARSDIYALGATLYHLLTNSFPKPAHLRALEIWAGRPDSLKPLNILNAEIPSEISDCLQKALEIERESRFVSAFEMQTALHEAISHEKRRKEAEERNLRLAEQAELKRERKELEAERRQLAEERQRHKKSDSEAERKRQEEREYEAKLKKWQNENLPVEISSEEKPIVDTLPSVTQPSFENLPAEDTFDWAELAEKKSLMEKSSPSYIIDFEFEAAHLKTDSDTIERVKPQTVPIVSAPTKPEKKKPFWLLPVVALAMLIFGIAALGMFLIFSNSGGTGANKSVKNPDTDLPTISPTPEPSASLTTSPAPGISDNEKPKPTVAPTTGKTTTRNQVKTPIPKTPKPAKIPDKSDECIYNGKCRN